MHNFEKHLKQLISWTEDNLPLSDVLIIFNSISKLNSRLLTSNTETRFSFFQYEINETLATFDKLQKNLIKSSKRLENNDENILILKQLLFLSGQVSGLKINYLQCILRKFNDIPDTFLLKMNDSFREFLIYGELNEHIEGMKKLTENIRADRQLIKQKLYFNTQDKSKSILANIQILLGENGQFVGADLKQSMIYIIDTKFPQISDDESKPSIFNIFKFKQRQNIIFKETQMQLRAIVDLNKADLFHQCYQIDEICERNSPSRWKFWRATERQKYQTIKREAKLICAINAFRFDKINATTFIAVLDQLQKAFPPNDKITISNIITTLKNNLINYTQALAHSNLGQADSTIKIMHSINSVLGKKVQCTQEPILKMMKNLKLNKSHQSMGRENKIFTNQVLKWGLTGIIKLAVDREEKLVAKHLR